MNVSVNSKSKVKDSFPLVFMVAHLLRMLFSSFLSAAIFSLVRSSAEESF